MSEYGKYSSNAGPGSKNSGDGVRRINAELISGLIRATDTLVIVGAATVVYWSYPPAAQAGWSSQYLTAILTAALVAAAAFQWVGAYRGGFLFARSLRANRVLAAWAGVVCILLAAGFALKITGTFSRVWAVSWFASAAAALISTRLGFGILIRRWARQGRFANRTIIVGGGAQGQRLFDHLRARGDGRTRVLGFAAGPGGAPAEPIAGCRDLGNLDRLLDMIRNREVDQVLIALPWSDVAAVHATVETLSTTAVQIRLAPDLLGFEFADRPFMRESGVPMLHLLDRPISGWAHVVKQVEDTLLAGLFIVLFAPLMLLIAFAIKLSSPGPVLFRQQRQGFNDEMFEVWKFRTIRHDQTDANVARQVTRGDPRVTPVGRFLRRYGLDELPQLFNVLGGRMSIVGPRPHSPGTKAQGEYFQDVVDRYAARHRVKPGITGWAQMNGWRGETDTIEKIQRRVDHDLYYIDHWSIWFDLRIILATPLTLLSAQNAY